MIQSKSDYREYVLSDKAALFISKKRPGLLDHVWKYERLLRLTEYYHNVRSDLIGRVLYYVLRILLDHAGNKLGFDIPINCCGKGLSLAHRDVIINEKASIGENCRIYSGVVIGSKGSGGGSPTLGNNVFVGTGAKLLGDITIADNVKIGANSVVIESIHEAGTVWAGIPAKRIIGRK